jgi:hypothetical protein
MSYKTWFYIESILVTIAGLCFCFVIAVDAGFISDNKGKIMAGQSIETAPKACNSKRFHSVDEIREFRASCEAQKQEYFDELDRKMCDFLFPHLASSKQDNPSII